MALHCVSLDCCSVSGTRRPTAFLLSAVSSQAASLWEAGFGGRAQSEPQAVSGSEPARREERGTSHQVLERRERSPVCPQSPCVSWRLDFLVGHSAALWLWVLKAPSLGKPDLGPGGQCSPFGLCGRVGCWRGAAWRPKPGRPGRRGQA